MKGLINHDGNGSVIINSKLALGTFAILLLTVFFSLVALVVTAQSNIVSNTEDIGEQKTIQNKLSDKINDQEIRITTIETHYGHIISALDRIEKRLKR